MPARSRYGALATLLLWLSFPAGAESKKLTTVVLALGPTLEAQALGVWQELQQAAAKDPRYTYVDPIQRAAMPELALRRARAEQAMTLHAAAVAALDALELEIARNKVEEAIKLFEQSDLTQNIQGLVESLALKAIILQIKKDAGAAYEIRRILTIDPSYRFQSTRINPAFARLIESRRETVLAAPRVTLEVAPPDVNALVYVDGKYRGVSPLEVKNLLPGRHYVTLLSPGFDLTQTTGVAGSRRVVAPQLKPTAEGKELLARVENLKAGFRQGAFLEPAREFGLRTEADEVLVITLQANEKGLQAELVRILMNGQHIVAAQTLDAGATEAVVPATLALLDRTPPVLLPGPTRSDEPGGSQQFEPSPRTWGYISLGTGAVTLVGGIIFGISAQRQAYATSRIPKVDTVEYARAVGLARARATAADSLYAMTLAGAGIGAWLLFWNEREPAPKPGKPPQKGVVLGVAPLEGGGTILATGSF